MAIRYGVLCVKHGMESKNWAGKLVMVPQPKTKKQRKSGGCPSCNADAKAAAKQAA